MHPSAEAVHFLKWLKTHNPPDRKSFFFMLLECQIKYGIYGISNMLWCAMYLLNITFYEVNELR